METENEYDEVDPHKLSNKDFPLEKYLMYRVLRIGTRTYMATRNFRLTWIRIAIFINAAKNHYT